MIVVDVETTGVDPEIHSIVSIGALDFFNPKNQFYEECKIWEGAEITQQALDVNGFTLKQVTDSKKQSLEEVVSKFVKWTKNIEDQTLAGENPSFDRDFLNNSFKRAGLEFYFGHRTVDLHSICYEHHLEYRKSIPLAKNRTDLNLDKILKYVGLPEEPKPHNALIGAKIEAEAFARLIYGKSILREFEKYSLPDYLIK